MVSFVAVVVVFVVVVVVRQEEMKDPAEFDVVVTSHETLSSEGSFFRKRFLWQLVIVDDGENRLRNDKTQLSQKLKQVRDTQLPLRISLLVADGENAQACRHAAGRPTRNVRRTHDMSMRVSKLYRTLLLSLFRGRR